MSERQITEWLCDRCGATVAVQVDRWPDKWALVGLRGTLRTDLERHLCPSCEGDFALFMSSPGRRFSVEGDIKKGDVVSVVGYRVQTVYRHGEGCHAARSDGECNWAGCPQLRDGEPVRSGRHCPLDWKDDER